MKIIFLVLTLSIKWVTTSYACEDTVPGALPPAPHGGVVEPMRSSAVEEEREPAIDGENLSSVLSNSNLTTEPKPTDDVFFEGVYKNKQLRLYPLAIKPPKTAVFSALSPKQDFSEVTGKVEFPWQNKTVPIVFEVTDDALVAPIDAENIHRFIVYLSATHVGQQKKVRIQLENE